MENEVQPNTLPVAPLPQVPVSSPKNWLKILSLILLVLIIIAISVFVGIQIGRSQITKQQPITERPTPVATNLDIKKRVKFRGWITTIWGDNPTTGESVIVYTISDGKQSYTLQVSEEVPNLMEFNGKEVQITGVETEIPDTIKVISIKTAN